MKRVFAAILAGGDSSRYGGLPKGSLLIGPGLTLMGRTVREVLRSGLRKTIIVANEPDLYRSYGLEVVRDLRPGNGPLGGIEAALEYYGDSCDGVLFLPCDLPGIGASEIQRLLIAFAGGADIIVFAATDRFSCQPLCAVVHNRLLKSIGGAINAGKRKVVDLWNELGGVPVHFPEETPFFNINSPEDTRRWRAQSSARATLRVPKTLQESMGVFLTSELIPLNLSEDAQASVEVRESDENVESDLGTLHVGGWIACDTARSLAFKLGIETREMGRLLNHLKIKTRACGLGCFK